MYNFSKIIGNDIIKDILNNNLGHAYIIQGSDNESVNILCEHLILIYVCENDIKPCEKCLQCKRHLVQSHTDVKYIDPKISPKDMRAIISKVYLLPNETQNKVYIINNADTMNEDTQNVLLKIIEESPDYVKFLFTCEDNHKILQTIRSRCILLRMDNSDSDDNFPIDENIHKFCEQFFSSFITNDIVNLMKIINFKNRENFKESVKCLLIYMQKKLKNTDNNIKTIKKITNICNILNEININLEYNLNLNIWSAYLLNKCTESMEEA